jgi:hypothetical protein
MRRALLWIILASSPLSNGIAAAQPLNSITFSSNGTWVVPPGVTRVILHGCGGGGGGGGGGGNARIIGSTYNDYAGGSGGAGGEGLPLVSFVQTVTAGSNIVITIGVGGAGGAGGKEAGEDGNPVGHGWRGKDGTETSFGAAVFFAGVGGGGGGFGGIDKGMPNRGLSVSYEGGAGGTGSYPNLRGPTPGETPLLGANFPGGKGGLVFGGETAYGAGGGGGGPGGYGAGGDGAEGHRWGKAMDGKDGLGNCSGGGGGAGGGAQLFGPPDPSGPGVGGVGGRGAPGILIVTW